MVESKGRFLSGCRWRRRPCKFRKKLCRQIGVLNRRRNYAATYRLTCY